MLPGLLASIQNNAKSQAVESVALPDQEGSLQHCNMQEVLENICV